MRTDTAVAVPPGFRRFLSHPRGTLGDIAIGDVSQAFPVAVVDFRCDGRYGIVAVDVSVEKDPEPGGIKI